MREVAKALFWVALREASVAAAFRKNVEYTRGTLRIVEDLYPIDPAQKPFVIAIGKAAHTMTEALTGQLGMQASGIVASSLPARSQLPGFRYFSGGHPIPNAESVRAAQAVLNSLATLNWDSVVIYLVSGGGSATVEKPIDDEILLEELVETYRRLVLSGVPIAEINAIRKHLSSTKGGRLARAAAAHNARQVSIMISDVPEGALDSLASGPTMPDSTTVEDCYRIARQREMLEWFPKSVRELFVRRALEETPKKDDPAFVRSRWWPILSSAVAQQSAAQEASRQGFTALIDNHCDDWEYQQAADYLLQRLRQLRGRNQKAGIISGGEVTVRVPEKSGVGGRNQQFALYCATKIKNENIAVLSAGTDGIDGNSPAAGAVVDGGTLRRAEEKCLNPQQALAGFDAYRFFKTLGDDVTTGSTGNNIRDLRVLLAW